MSGPVWCCLSGSGAVQRCAVISGEGPTDQLAVPPRRRKGMIDLASSWRSRGGMRCRWRGCRGGVCRWDIRKLYAPVLVCAASSSSDSKGRENEAVSKVVAPRKTIIGWNCWNCLNWTQKRDGVPLMAPPTPQIRPDRACAWPVLPCWDGTVGLLAGISRAPRPHNTAPSLDRRIYRIPPSAFSERKGLFGLYTSGLLPDAATFFLSVPPMPCQHDGVDGHN